MITLYYIKGITRLDEPSFDTKDNQKAFFKSNEVVTIDSGFYPPHFHNQILLSTEDVTFDTKINYLSLTYNDKEYYYFIDSIEYVSEDTINLNVTMDVIQTYFHLIKILNGTIVRRSIERWEHSTGVWKINRNYIRENLSQGKFVSEKKFYDVLYPDIVWYIIWIRSNTNLYYKDSSGTLPYDDGTKYNPLPVVNGIQITNGKNGKYYRRADMYCTPYFVPVSTNPDYPTVTINGESTNASFEHLVEDTNVIRIVRIDKDIFSDKYTVTKKNGIINLIFPTTSIRTLYDAFWYEPVEKYRGSDGNYYEYKLHHICLLLGLPDTTMLAPVTKTVIDYIDWLPTLLRNTHTTAIFRNDYVPAMLDDNYVHIYYGEQMNYITYPLHYLTTNTLYAVNIIDWLSGTRIYGLMADEYKGDFDDPYTNIGICNSQEYLDLYNDAWLSYYSRNTATWTMGYQLNKQQNLYKFYSGEVQTLGNTIGSMMGGSMSNSAITTLAEGNMFSGGSYASYMGNMGKMIGTGIQGVTKGVGILADYFQNNYVLEQERKISKANYDATPDTEKQGNTLTADTLTYATATIIRMEEVDDFDDVAMEIERVGYKVNNKIEASINLSGINTRYYYDCITIENPNVILTKYIADEATITNIKNRLENGLRLWHTTNGILNTSICNFNYDNVETSFIE